MRALYVSAISDTFANIYENDLGSSAPESGSRGYENDLGSSVLSQAKSLARLQSETQLLHCSRCDGENLYILPVLNSLVAQQQAFYRAVLSNKTPSMEVTPTTVLKIQSARR